MLLHNTWYVERARGKGTCSYHLRSGKDCQQPQLYSADSLYVCFWLCCVCVSSIHCQECSYSALHLTSLYTPHIVQPLLLVSVQPVYIQLLVHLSPEHLSRCWYASVYTCLIMHAALSLCGNYFLSHKWGMFDWHMPWALCMVFNYVHTLVLVSDWNVWL